MGNLGPMVLAWSHLRHKRGGLLGPLLILVVCLTLLFTQVGLYQAASAVSDEASLARGFLIGLVGLLVLLPMQLRSLLVSEMADRSREYALLHTLGYSPLYLRSVVLAEMLLLVLLACVPAVALLPGVYAIVRAWTGLPVAFRLAPLICTILLTTLLTSLVALLASMKLGAAPGRDLLE